MSISINSISSKDEGMRAKSGWRQTIAAYAELTKLRISAMVVFTFCVTGSLSAGVELDFWRLLFATLGMILIAGSGNAMNMYLERYTDFLMPRTAGRPLPSIRLSAIEVATFAAVCLGVSLGVFVALVNWQTAVCGIATWVLYVWLYTPLKSQTAWNTEVGAVAGAMPVLMGSLATTGQVTWVAWSIFVVLFIWQFPHFMAIAWMYREQYADGRLRMLTVVDPTGRRAARKSLGWASLLLPASWLGALAMESQAATVVYLFAATVVAIFYLQAAIRFYREINDGNARKLLRASLVYLPIQLLLVVAGCVLPFSR